MAHRGRNNISQAEKDIELKKALEIKDSLLSASKIHFKRLLQDAISKESESSIISRFLVETLSELDEGSLIISKYSNKGYSCSIMSDGTKLFIPRLSADMFHRFTDVIVKKYKPELKESTTNQKINVYDIIKEKYASENITQKSINEAVILVRSGKDLDE